MKTFKNLALVTAMLLGILLLPIVADAQCYNNDAYQCAVPENNYKTMAVAPAHIQPAMFPATGGTFWHKWHRYKRSYEHGHAYGQWNNYNRQYNYNDWWNYNFPYGDNFGYGYGPTMSYGNGPSYGSGGYAPADGYIDYAQRHARQPYGNGGYKYPRGSDSRYVNFATNNGRGAYSGPPIFDYSKGRYDNPPTKEELGRHGSYDTLPESYNKKIMGSYDNPPTPAELSSHGSYDSLPAEYVNAEFGSYY